MDSPEITRKVREDAEHRITGGPNAEAAFELLPADARARFEDDPEVGIKGLTETLWSAWLDLTVKLQMIGYPARALCDASNTVAEAWTEKTRSGERQHA